MSGQVHNGLFVAEGTSDGPLAQIVETLFVECGAQLRLHSPDFSLLPKVNKDVKSRLTAGIQLVGGPVEVFVVHRDADNAGWESRQEEILRAAGLVGCAEVIPVIPVRMTEAWLLLDEVAVRQVAGNPNGKTVIPLPSIREIERVADPKQLLRECLAGAADVTGRRREKLTKRFPHHRRQLLERLDPHGPVTSLASWRRLVADIGRLAEMWESAL